MTRLLSGRGEVALHTLHEGPGPTLLCLHALGGRAADFAELAPHWQGRVLALDFSGHGESARPCGAGYTPELLVGDADVALAQAGEAYLLGVGLGAWVALLLAGARPQRVLAAYLLPGRGLEGGGPWPRTHIDGEALRLEVLELIATAARRDATPGPDPMLRLLEQDPRPPDYARVFADAAQRLLLAEDGELRPPWWEAVREAACALRAPADVRTGLVMLRGDAD